ncbi:4072_t:CDS:2, partial [Acaulospora morrowiae]
MSGHSISHRLTKQQLERVREMTVSGSRSRKIVSTLRQNDELTLVTNRDIYNAREQLRQQYLAGRTPIQALVDKLQEGDLYQVRKTISLAIINQKKEIDAMIASERIRFPAFVHNNLFYANVKEMISTFALKKINEQYQKINNTAIETLLPCTESFSNTMGLPCAYIIQHLGDKNLTLDNIHKHWWINEYIQTSSTLPINRNKNLIESLLQDLKNRYQNWPEYQQVAVQKSISDIINTPSVILQNPQIIRTKGHPSGSSNNRSTNSTKRDPSGFEFIECK